MAWQVGEQQTVPLVCYLNGVATAPTAPIITQVNVEGAGFAETTNAATDEGNGAVSVVLEANEVGAWGFVRVVGDNGAEGVQPYTAEGDWTKARAEQIDDLALEATLDEIKGAGWTDETLAAIHALVEALNDLSSADAQAAAAAALAAYDAATGTDVTNATSGLSTFDAATDEVNVGEVGGTPVTGPADLKADVSNLATSAEIDALNDLSAAEVQGIIDALALHGDGAWSTADLTGISTLTEAQVRTLIDEVKGAGWTNETLVEIMGAIQTLAQVRTLIDMLPAEVDALLSAEHGAGLWGGAAGTGAYTVTLILSDGAGRLAGGLAVAIRDLAGNTVAGPLATDTSGRVTYYLDAGDYAVVTPSTLVWLGSSTPLTVTGDTDVDITVGTRSIPLPSAPDKFVIIVNAADEFGDLVGAEAWRIRITDVQPRGLPGVDLVQLTRHEPIVLDANGQATFEIAKETRTFTLVITPRLVAGADGATEIIQVTVDPTLANEYDQIYLADLLTE